MSEDNPDDLTRTHIQIVAGTVIRPYRIVEKIGAGGMGEVYLAEDTKLDRKVALKFLPLHLCQDPECRARFTREAQASAKLDHPNIVAVHEVGEFQGRPFFSMQHVEGQTLKEVLSGKPLLIDRILEIGIQVCEGLQAAHDKGITHRDIKPSNILIDSHGRARIADFGLASVMGSDHLTKTGSTLGTIGYMSPEQVRGDKVDHRTDLFSFGVVLYEMITGHAPFKADSEAATLHAITNTKPELLARFKREMPVTLQAMIDKVLDKNVATRYQHADELSADLRRLTPAGVKQQTPRRDLWNRYVVMAAVAVILIVVGYWGVTRFSTEKGQKPETTRKMLAVLPFENLGLPEDEYFADGMTEEITTSLASLSGLGVISRTSSMQYKNTEKSLKLIGKELNVDYVLEGTIRWEKTGSESRVRISPQLIRVSDDSHIWANRFDAVLTDVFQVQSTIAHQVATALDVTLLQSEQEILSRKLDVDSRAYDYYLRGKQYFSITRFQQREWRLAEKMHLKAIDLAPDFAQAYAELGALYTEMYWNQSDPSPQRLVSGKKMIDIAVRLAPNNVETHEALGWYYYHGLRDFERALGEFSKVLELQPSNTPALSSTAWVQRRQGKWQEAIAGLELVDKLDPRDPWYKYELGITYQYCRRFMDAIAQYDPAIDMQPNLTWAYILKSWALFNQSGETRAARAVLEAGRACNGRWPELTWLEAYYDLCDRDYNHALSLMTAPGAVFSPENSDTSDYYSLKGFTYKLMGQPQVARVYFDSARVRLESALPAASNSASLLSSLATVYAGLGQIDKAVSMARRATELVPVSADALDGPIYVRALAMVYAQVGQQDQAIELAAYLLTIPSNASINALRLVPEFASLRDNPRFQELLKRYEREHGT
jgi:serine/threonine protein kinase/tetratricopeptide (TPR) repeat protein